MSGPPDADEGLYESGDGYLREQLARLRSLSTIAVAAAQDPDAPPTVLREAAGLARSITGILGEIRQRERHMHAVLKKLTPAERLAALCSMVGELPVGDRARVRALLDELDAGVGVLG